LQIESHAIFLLKQFSSVVHEADIIISSTAASVPIIGKGLIESALKTRKHKPMFMLVSSRLFD
jgi:glutamyl-tRNA reductase